MTDIESNWPYTQIVPEDDEALHDVLVAIENELDRIDVQADELMEQRFIDTATTQELRKLAAEVGVSRETNESTARFRFRATVAKAITRSDGTIPDVAQVLRLIFGEDVNKITLEPVTGDPVIRIRVQSVLIDDLPVTQSELETILLDAIPMGDSFEVITDDAFILGESGAQGLGSGELQ